MMSHRDYLPVWLSVTIVRLSRVVDHCDNAITYKAQRDKMPENPPKLANAAITDYADASA